MKHFLLFLLFSIFNLQSVIAQDVDIDSIINEMNKIEETIKYEKGQINFETGEATLNVPSGYNFLNAEQTQYILEDLWGNLEDKSVLGAIIPENIKVTSPNCWMFIISYNEIGYVNDEDANEINYDELLADMKKDVDEANLEREKLGYETAELIGWASKPFYDNNLKVLHWAKEFKFGDDELNTLNYDLRILGRKGMFNISAVASIDQLDEVQKSIPQITKSINYNDGAKYSDFDSSIDDVAAWTIGGLVAGKVLAKTGFLAILAKFGKFIIVGLLAAFGAARKFLFGNKEQVVSKEQIETDSTTKEDEA